MYSLFVTIHSTLFLVVLALGILSIFKGLTGKTFAESDRKVGLFYMISLHTQLIIGLVLYLGLSPVTTAAFADFGAAMKDPATRLILVEHVSVNIIAIVLATVVNAKNKKAITDAAKFKNMWLLNGIGLVLILSRIPWSRLFA
jgi:uncharacterized membrane protein YozB (DUF420 family)